MKKHFKLILPWVLAIVILVFLLKKTPPQELWPIIKESRLILFFIFSFIYFTGMLLLDCLGLYWLIKRFASLVNFKEIVLMRGATYLIMFTNYIIGQSSIAFYLKKTKNIPLFKTMGIVFYSMIIDLSLMALFCLIAVVTQDVFYQNVSLRPFIVSFVILFYSFLIAWGFFWRHLGNRLMLSLSHIKIIKWILSHDTFFIFKECSFKDYLKILAIRTPTVMWVIFSIYLMFFVFKSWVPWKDIVTFSPPILFIGSLPITPAGLGTVQALCIEFFSTNLSGTFVENNSFKPQEIILTASLCWVFANLAYKFLFGLFCLHKRSRYLFTHPT